MLGTVRRNRYSPALPALLAVLAALAAGCATSMQVDIDEHEDFSNYRTWDWMPQIRPRVEAPSYVSTVFEVRLARLIESSLTDRGFEHTNPPADFYVTYRLEVQRKSEWVEEPMAPYLLSSLHSSPSYWVEGSNSVARRYDDFRLSIGVTEGAGRTTWRAALEQRVEAPHGLPLEDAVAKLFDSFPSTGPRAEPVETQ